MGDMNKASSIHEDLKKEAFGPYFGPYVEPDSPKNANEFGFEPTDDEAETSARLVGLEGKERGLTRDEALKILQREYPGAAVHDIIEKLFPGETPHNEQLGMFAEGNK